MYDYSVELYDDNWKKVPEIMWNNHVPVGTEENHRALL